MYSLRKKQQNNHSFIHNINFIKKKNHHSQRNTSRTLHTYIHTGIYHFTVKYNDVM